MQRVAFVFVTIFRGPPQRLHDLLGQAAGPNARIAASGSFSGIGNRRPGVSIGGQRYAEAPDHGFPQLGFVPERDDDQRSRGSFYRFTEARGQKRITRLAEANTPRGFGVSIDGSQWRHACISASEQHVWRSIIYCRHREGQFADGHALVHHLRFHFTQ